MICSEAIKMPFWGHFQLIFFGSCVYKTHNASYMCLQFFSRFWYVRLEYSNVEKVGCSFLLV